MDYGHEEEDYEEVEVEQPEKESDELELAIQELIPKLGTMTPDAVRGIALRAAREIAYGVRTSVVAEVKKVVMAACGAELQRMAREHMTQAFAEALTSKVYVGNTWEKKELSIREVIEVEMKEALGKLKGDNTRDSYVKEIIKSFLAKELQEMAQKAVAEFKADILQQLTRESTQRLTQSIAKALASDTKLLNVLKAME